MQPENTCFNDILCHSFQSIETSGYISLTLMFISSFTASAVLQLCCWSKMYISLSTKGTSHVIFEYHNKPKTLNKTMIDT